MLNLPNLDTLARLGDQQEGHFGRLKLTTIGSSLIYFKEIQTQIICLVEGFVR